MNNYQKEKILKKYYESNSSILIFSDLHLNQNNYNNDINAKIFLEKLSEYIRKENIKLLFFLGDWLEKKENIKIDELIITSNFFKNLKELDCCLVFVFGNHDIYNKNKIEENIKFASALYPFSLIDNIILVDKYENIIFEEEKVVFHFYPFFSEDSILKKQNNNKNNKKILKQTVIQNIKKINNSQQYYHYLFGHFELDNVLYKAGRFSINKNDYNYNNNFYVDIDFLKENFITSFLGHYHQIFFEKDISSKNSNSSNILKYLFVGSCFQNNFNDAEEKKGVFVIKNINKDNYNIKFIENDYSPKFFYVRLSKFKKDDKIDIDTILNTYKNSYLRIVIDCYLSTEKIVYELKEQLMRNNYYVDVILDINSFPFFRDKQNILLQNVNILPQENDFEFKGINISLNNKEDLCLFLQKYIELFFSEKDGENFKISKEDLLSEIKELIDF